MNHHACRFIDDQDGFIFIGDVQWYKFRNNFAAIGCMTVKNDDLIERFYFIIILYRFIIYQNQFIVYGLLDFVARSSFDTAH